MHIRRARPDDVPTILALVEAVVREVYADLVEKNGLPPERDASRWSRSLVAEADGTIIAVGCATNDYISDLWVAQGHRSRGVGAELLRALEAQVLAAGNTVGRLHVVASNERARAFYAAHGWREVGTHLHERDGHLMVDMECTFS